MNSTASLDIVSNRNMQPESRHFEPSDGIWMRRCAELSQQASSAGNTPVGSVVVIAGTMIAEASEETPCGDRNFAHAELLAIEACIHAIGPGSLERATLYSTAEPCILCGFAIREAGIGRVVIGRPSGDIGSVRGKFAVLTTNEIEDWGPPPEIVWWFDLVSENPDLE